MENNGWFKLAEGSGRPGSQGSSKPPAPTPKPEAAKPAPTAEQAVTMKAEAAVKVEAEKTVQLTPKAAPEKAPAAKPAPKAAPKSVQPRSAAPAATPGKAEKAQPPAAPLGNTPEPPLDQPPPPAAAKPRPPARPEPLPAPAPPTPPSGFPDDTAHSQTIGPRGPVLHQDTVLHETLEEFVHEKRVERAVHVKGFGAHGYYQNLHSMREYTTASVFSSSGQIPVLTRFSLAVSNKGTPDTGRNVRGFATKFYLGDGVFDLLCNHIPVFLVRDAMRFPESIKAFLPSPVSNLGDPNIFWGFIATAPEATHFVTWLYSDVGTIKSLRHIHGHSVNTYVWKNAAGVRHFVKYHWLPKAGEQYIDAQEAARLAAENPDTAGQDLWDTIAAGKTVEYELNVQIMDPRDYEKLPFDPLDCTKTWDEEDYPLRPVGRLVLNRNPDDYNEQIEKVAFSPANLIEGIEISDDKMLQGRANIYWDAQRYRLGPDFRRLPVNKGARFTPDQLPSSGLGEVREGYEMRAEIPKADDFAQAGERYLMLTDAAQARMIDNIAADLHAVKPEIQRTVIGYFSNANEEFGTRVEEAVRRYQAGKA